MKLMVTNTDENRIDMYSLNDVKRISFENMGEEVWVNLKVIEEDEYKIATIKKENTDKMIYNLLTVLHKAETDPDFFINAIKIEIKTDGEIKLLELKGDNNGVDTSSQNKPKIIT